MLALLLVGCSPLFRDWPDRMDYPIREADVPTEIPSELSELRVMAWNVKYGAGRIDFWFDGWGDTVVMEEDDVLANLENVRTIVKAFHPDVLMTSEIEVGSKRSAYVDMVDNLLNDPELGFNYAGFVPNWEVMYVPGHGVGRIEMGNAVFSKFPITKNERVDLGPIEDQDPLTKAFYLDRCVQVAELTLPTGDFTVYNNHPDAYSTDGTKIRQLEQIFAEAAADDGDMIVGGDLNVVPPGSIRRDDFADDNTPADARGVTTVDYLGEEEEQVLLPWYERWDESTEQDHGDSELSLAAYMAATTEEEQVGYYSHSISKDHFWTRRLDYLFSNRSWSAGRVFQAPEDGYEGPLPLDPMDLSDHAPVVGVLELE